jgi:hypothetical protein
MTRLQIAMIVGGSALIVTGIIGFYLEVFASGSHPYVYAWLAALSFAVAGLSFARALSTRTRSD